MAVAVSMPNFDKAIEYKADKVITDRSDKEYFKPGEYDSAKYVRFEGEQRGKAIAYKLQTQGRVASRADLEPEVYKAIKAKCGVDCIKGGHLSNAFDCKGLGWARQRLGATGTTLGWCRTLSG